MQRVSVVITTHNRPQLLPRAIESARIAGTDVEIVVVDDASADETAEICRGIADIRYVRVERNQRVAGARNLGILASTGKYITFLDDDDVRLSRSLDLQLKILDASPHIGLVYGQVLEGDQHCAPKGEFYPVRCPQGDIFWALLERNFIPCGTAVFRRSCLYRVGLLDEAIPGVDDWDLWLRIAEMYQVGAIEQPVAIWRRPNSNSGQGSSKPVELILRSIWLLRHKWLKLPRAAEASRRQRLNVVRKFSDNVVEHLFWEMTNSVLAGKFSEAKMNLETLLRLHPSSILKVIRKRSRPSTVNLLLAGAFGREEMSAVKARLKSGDQIKVSSGRR